MIIDLFLPLPVTLNKLTHNNRSKNGGKGGRSKTKRAKDWYREAKFQAMPFVKGNQAECTKNIMTLAKYWDFGKKGYDLQRLQRDHLNLSYRVVYRYWFEQERHKLPRDIFNYEKQLSDFLVDMGFILDDSFIDDGQVIRAGTDAQNPRVEIIIEKIIK